KQCNRRQPRRAHAHAERGYLVERNFHGRPAQPPGKAHRDQHEASRRVGGVMGGGGGHVERSGRGREEGRGDGVWTAAVCSRKARWLAKIPTPVRTFPHVAPQLSVCYATARSRGFWERAGVLPRKCRVPLNLKGFAPTVHGGADPSELPEEINVAGE